MARTTKTATSTTAKAPESTPTPATTNVVETKRANAVDTRTTLTHDQIARRAYEIYLARGADQHGRDLEDWYQAERELRLGRQ